jgi:KDO2-lipid IV(A) lauroyltransferase
VLARRGPATLALRTGAAVVPVYLVHNKGQGLKLIIEPELDLIRVDKDKAAVRENTLRMTQWLERTVRAYPEQWNWMNIHWQGDGDNTAVAKEQRVQGLTS